MLPARGVSLGSKYKIPIKSYRYIYLLVSDISDISSGSSLKKKKKCYREAIQAVWVDTRLYPLHVDSARLSGHAAITAHNSTNCFAFLAWDFILHVYVEYGITRIFIFVLCICTKNGFQDAINRRIWLSVVYLLFYFQANQIVLPTETAQVTLSRQHKSMKRHNEITKKLEDIKLAFY